uniref:Prolyl 4-hydroxylase alpha subunit domain-containing protein n=1 Tax=Entomoneis paludosa TaxID=265537 RepID=A0A7S2V6U5_9STRA|mmetsp:Transcript_10173/g.21015  ORF Transcript_10173/g.21015 Transcript_10173/m.21015 type:complete len:232 (+) Transcript_10173:35-730(+)
MWNMLSTPRKEKKVLADCLETNQEINIQAKLVQRPEPLYWRTATCEVLKHALTTSECGSIIDRAEKIGFEAALVNVGMGKQQLITDYRNSDRLIIDDTEFATILFKRIWDYIPQEFRDPGGKVWKATCLNERMRILRYKKGHFFKKHMDGQYDRPDGSESSRITVMIYLNGDYEGGHTLMYADEFDESVTVQAEPGMIFIFDHRLAHEAPTLQSGVKYAIRTDIMYAETVP